MSSKSQTIVQTVTPTTTSSGWSLGQNNAVGNTTLTAQHGGTVNVTSTDQGAVSSAIASATAQTKSLQDTLLQMFTIGTKAQSDTSSLSQTIAASLAKSSGDIAAASKGDNSQLMLYALLAVAAVAAVVMLKR